MLFDVSLFLVQLSIFFLIIVTRFLFVGLSPETKVSALFDIEESSFPYSFLILYGTKLSRAAS